MNNTEKKEIETYVCPFIDKCEFYENWESQRTNKVDIIYKTKDGYCCLAQIAIKTSEEKGGISLSPGLEKRLQNKNAGCSWIENLNMVYQQGILTKKLHDYFLAPPKQQKPAATKPVQSTTTQQGNKILTSVTIAPIIPTQNGGSK